LLNICNKVVDLFYFIKGKLNKLGCTLEILNKKYSFNFDRIKNYLYFIYNRLFYIFI